MRTALIVLILIHGIIHLFGFLKGFGFAEFNAISQPISRANGLLWLLAFVLFVATILLNLIQSEFWWLCGLFAVIVSQTLIFTYWSDAKFGSLLNLIILLAVLTAYASFNFKNETKKDRIALLKNAPIENEERISLEAIQNLPPIVQKWLKTSGVIGTKRIFNVYLTKELQMKLKPNQDNWNFGQAEQYFTIEKPAFIWNVNTEMNSFLKVVGRDKFADAKGEMIIKLFSLIPVVNAKNDNKTDQATLQRYLAEIVWFPSAALSEYIKWETLDQYSAKATMTYKGIEGSGVFHFDSNGNFEKLTTMRYQDSNAEEPTQWTVIAKKTEQKNGIKIPVECEASWELESGKWTWLKLKITDITYNVEKIQ